MAKGIIAESWEDADISDTEDSLSADFPTSKEYASRADGSSNHLKPNILASRNTTNSQLDDFDPRAFDVRTRGAAVPTARPEKTVATASRLIAGALGVRNQRTDEQKQYDRATREKEKKRLQDERDAKRKAEENKEKAKQAMWDD